MDPNFNRFQTKRKNRRVRIRVYLWLAGIFLAFVGIFYVVQLSPVFKVRNFNISGKEHLTDKEVLKIIGERVMTSRIGTFLGSDNLLTWSVKSPDTSKTALLKAVIDRDWIKQSVNIAIEERERIAIWCDSKGDCSWIDVDGMLFEKAPQVEGSLILTVKDVNSGYISIGAKISEDRFIKNIIDILEGLKAMKLAVKYISFDSKLQEIHVENYSGPAIFFSIRFDPSTNMDSLRTMMEKQDFKKYPYIDLRVENRIYYKSS